jgi:hypothetical protein
MMDNITYKVYDSHKTKLYIYVYDLNDNKIELIQHKKNYLLR